MLNDSRWPQNKVGQAPVTDTGTAACRGFTLLELLIALAIVGILAALSVPNLSGLWLRSQRTDAWLALAQAHTAQEQYRSEAGQYAADLAALGLPAHSPAQRYRIAVEQSSPTGFTLSATAQGPQGQDAACRHLTLQSTAERLIRSSGPVPHESNNQSTNHACWGIG